ncbi:CU044_5270 family protein [Streptomyces gibsoniae]|uniref:CU044_5270 family protein n=1 Tax=Streptomyces gibsoniae TaxID=3075529 RepID=A0ABU2TLT1_9ACTN|nr:CU044_5270 family protein [Streptomyces sp. DSM 41699]MDT0461906.1 CU044_5270 family protein [Streptomyces sp. DSM 41699]
MKNTRKRSGRPDVMQVLADARPDALDPSRLVDPVRQREDLARIVAGATDDRAAHDLASRRRGSGFRLLGAAGLAAVAASVVAVTTLHWQAPAERPAAQPRSSAGTKGAGAGADVRVDGHFELLSAARKAETSAAEGTYWQTTTRSEHVDVGGENGQLFAVRSTSTDEWSVGVRPATRSLMVSGLNSVTEPRTAADEARWHAAGSPGTVRVEVANTSGTGMMGYTMGTRRPMVMRTNIDDRIHAVGPRNVTYQDLRELSAISGELRQYLERLHAEDNGAGTGDSAWMLRQAADLVTMPVKPAVRAAAYRVMADLPGVRVVARVTDPLGRQGVGVEFPGTFRTPLGSTRQQLVVDPFTGALLSEEAVLVEPSARAEAAGLDAGTTVNYAATTRMSWGERQITVPENARS